VHKQEWGACKSEEGLRRSTDVHDDASASTPTTPQRTPAPKTACRKAPRCVQHKNSFIHQGTEHTSIPLLFRGALAQKLSILVKRAKITAALHQLHLHIFRVTSPFIPLLGNALCGPASCLQPRAWTVLADGKVLLSGCRRCGRTGGPPFRPPAIGRRHDSSPPNAMLVVRWAR